ncbi:hypothetical protein PF005_g23852 [Phytophthora fragariae]|uniref:Crinkler effector protein N-terminal domain-containing protein n=1 Tax=Phytophthora fragariae TaxID=53985 RepID=A0A6A3W563_9STRA|nr:hypothetical protein PF003_g4070 [Phytophthora fragariae]KAE8924994.1 hypothetical protein PF009_g24784 [Phytophthora fragariae]KAE8979959.1 hypothetical protein PF011_g22631 [Phytophthora fragariae]KAE9060887.1 hypothetical protein PF007_g30447 [Phytophthora fragariae]KAE9098839.1 hypothetical protein PF006_g23268 [Phytophthora fragariae]
MVTTLTCLLLGLPDEEPFDIEVDSQSVVDTVKAAIKAKNPDIQCPNRKLRLYLAKQDSGGAWLDSQDSVISELKTGEIPAKLELLTRKSIDPQALVREVFSDAPPNKAIHVLVKVIGDKSASAVVKSVMPVFDEGWTSAWKKAFNSEQVLPEALPPVDDLGEFLDSELPVKIGVPESFYTWSRQFWYPEKIFKATDSEPCVEFLHQVGYRTLCPVYRQDTKASYISHWDDSIRHVLEFVLRGQSSRYSIDAPLDGGPATPDFVFMLDSVCVLRGEEAGPKPILVDSPRFRKFDQVRWTHGNVPYLFGYTTDTSIVSLYALTRQSPDSNQIRSRRLDSYNISSTDSRFHLLLAVLNMSRLLQSIFFFSEVH